MKIAIASFGQETSSFSPLKTSLKTFKLYGLYEAEEMIDNLSNHSSLSGFIKKIRSLNNNIIIKPIFRAWAGASGIITDETYFYFENKLEKYLKLYGKIDGLFFDLHGAGQAESIPDTEGELLSITRKLLGNNIPLVIALDHHANLTKLMINSIDGLVAHRTQPHIPFQTGELAAKMLIEIIQKKIKPIIAFQKIPMITHQEQFLTDKGPMKKWFDFAREIEFSADVISASTFPMQPWLDVPEGGWSTVVITDNKKQLAKKYAADLAQKAWGLRNDFMKFDSVSPEDAIRKALSKKKGLVVLSDTGDSVFGGATGDSTCILREMLNQKIEQTALVPIVDPEVVETAILAGEGQNITVNIGGKLDTKFYNPIKISGKVMKIGGGILKAEVVGLDSFDMGRSVLIKVGTIYIVVTQERGVGGNHPIVYNHFGLDPSSAKMIVLKTASNWQYYKDMISEIIRVDTPGATMSQVNNFVWENIPRPIFPLDEEINSTN